MSWTNLQINQKLCENGPLMQQIRIQSRVDFSEQIYAAPEIDFEYTMIQSCNSHLDHVIILEYESVQTPWHHFHQLFRILLRWSVTFSTQQIWGKSNSTRTHLGKHHHSWPRALEEPERLYLRKIINENSLCNRQSQPWDRAAKQ